MMNYDYLIGNNGGFMMAGAWLMYILMIVLLILGIVALTKYISK
ncbi:MAG: hypothetical protein ACD_58C00200G0005 [uncultured bacterium]|nr:MAG: hypothetical protein ACD_58C00200G0005 [uncultured bacterium]